MTALDELPACDLAIVGGGIAGMVAAVRAAREGLRVAVLERLAEEQYLCNTRMSSGIFHCALHSVTTDPAALRQAIADATEGRAEDEQVLAVSSDALRAVRWLQAQGMRFIKGAQPYYDFTLAPPTVDPQNRGWNGRGGDVLLRTLEAALKDAGGRVVRGRRARRLIMEAGRCLGLDGEGTEGAFRIHAANTLIADGGFQSEPALLRNAISPEPQKVLQRNARSGRGDGLRMAQEAGAALSDLRGFYGHVLSADALQNDRLWPHLWLDFVAAAGLLVDRSGRRFTDEGRGGVSMANAIAAQPDPLGTLVIADQRIWQERGTLNVQAPNPRLAEYGGTVHAAASLQELALRAGIDAAQLEATVSAYNAALKEGRLGELAPVRSTRKSEPMPILLAPFYALPACAGITYTMGGILIDGSSRVLDRQRRPIPGLYAAGAATGGLEGGPHAGYVGGLVKSAVTGLRAAEHMLQTRAAG